MTRPATRSRRKSSRQKSAEFPNPDSTHVDAPGIASFEQRYSDVVIQIRRESAQPSSDSQAREEDCTESGTPRSGNPLRKGSKTSARRRRASQPPPKRRIRSSRKTPNVADGPLNLTVSFMTSAYRKELYRSLVTEVEWKRLLDSFVSKRNGATNEWWTHTHIDLALGLLWAGLWDDDVCVNRFRWTNPSAQHGRGGRYLLMDTDTPQYASTIWNDTEKYLTLLHSTGEASGNPVIILREPPKIRGAKRRRTGATELQLELRQGDDPGEEKDEWSRLQGCRNILNRMIRRLSVLQMGTSEESFRTILSDLRLPSGIWAQDAALFPFCMNNNHWVSVVLTGMRKFYKVILSRKLSRNGRGGSTSDNNEQGSQNHTEEGLQVIFLDSLRDTEAYLSRKTVNDLSSGTSLMTLFAIAWQTAGDKNNFCSSHLRLAMTVIFLLASELTPQTDDGNDDDTDWITQGWLFLIKNTSVFFPPVPQQHDYSQCGPMAVLSLKTFVENEQFRKACTTYRPSQRSLPMSPYSSASSYDARLRLMHFISFAEDALQSGVHISL